MGSAQLRAGRPHLLLRANAHFPGDGDGRCLRAWRPHHLPPAQLCCAASPSVSRGPRSRVDTLPYRPGIRDKRPTGGAGAPFPPPGPFSVCWGLSDRLSRHPELGLQGSGSECPDSGSGNEGSSCFCCGFACLHLNPGRGRMSRWLPPGPGIPGRDQPLPPPPVLSLASARLPFLPGSPVTSAPHPGPRCMIRCSCLRVPVESSSKNMPLPTSCCHRDARRHVWLAA